MGKLASLLDRHIGYVHRTRVKEPRPEQNIVVELFYDLCSPSRDSSHGKDGDEQVIWNIEQVVDRSREEVDVLVDSTPAVGLHDFYHGLQDLEPPGLAFALTKLARVVLKVNRSRIDSLIDPVPEPHNATAAADTLSNVVLGVLLGANLLGHLHDLFCRAAVGRPFEDH